MSDTTLTPRQRLLLQAEKLVGRRGLVRGLNATASVVEAWISGHREMPDHKMLALATLLDRKPFPSASTTPPRKMRQRSQVRSLR